MTKTADDLYDAVMALPEPDRTDVVERLAAAIVPPRAGLHPAWGPELRRRAAQLDSGEVVGIPHEESRRRRLAVLTDAGLTRD